MGRASSRRSSRLRGLRRLAAGLCLAGGPLLGPGCVGISVVRDYPEVPPRYPAPTASAQVPRPAGPAQGVVPASHTAPAQALPPAPAQLAPLTVGGAPQLLPAPKELPITLDTVLRLAEQHNPRVGAAREKLGSSQAQAEGALGGWLPQVYAGVAYYRHEGGIQNFQGDLIHSSTQALFPGLQIQGAFDIREATYHRVDAERKAWQSKAELSQVSNEVLLDAAQTYVDLLTARRGEQVALDLQRLERDLLQRSERLAQTERAARMLVETLRSSTTGREVALAKLRQQGNAASAKLVYLLGLPPGTCLVPVDNALVPIELVDCTASTAEMVAQVMASGPGVRELEGIVAAIQSGIEELSGRRGLLPCVLLNAFEGPFGAGPGANLAWDNRFDLGVQLRWNLTALLSAREQRRQAESQIHQVELTKQDVQGKLALGVEEARDAVLSGREQMNLAALQIKHASEAHRLAELRVKEGVQGATLADVFQTLRALEQGHLSHVSAISSHNKAQVRLMVLLGCLGNAARPAGGYVSPAVPAPPEKRPAEKDREREGAAQQLPAPRKP